MARLAYFCSALIALVFAFWLVRYLQESGFSQSFSMFWIAVVGLVLIKVCSIVRPGESIWGRFSRRQFSVFMLCILALQVVFQVLRAALGADDGGAQIVREMVRASFLGALVAAPLFEEAVCRGLLWRALEFGKSRMAVAIPVIVTATSFAVIHGSNPGQLALMGAVGIILGIARAATGGIALPLALHIGMNVYVAVAAGIL